VNRFILTILTVALAGVAAACASDARPVALPGAGDRMELGSSISATCPGTPGPPATHVRGDFNGDGTDDVVLWVTTAGTSRLVALFARLDGEYTVAEVGDATVVPSGNLEVGRRSTGYQLASLTIDSYFGLDTIVLRACDGTRTAWFWTGGTFQAQPLAR
jgi:hypothetical protein